VLHQLLDLFLHLDRHLAAFIQAYGGWTYLMLTMVIFLETGVVVTPFLPGDSLLFAAGALAASHGSPINVGLVWILLLAAAILGDAANYGLGHHLGPRVFSRTDSKLLNREHLLRTQRFYEKYGGKTIFLARFVPIIRTFAPFVAGVGRMAYTRFAIFNITGALTWVTLMLFSGYLFGNLPVVANNFSIVVLAIIALSLLPILIEYLKARAEARRAA